MESRAIQIFNINIITIIIIKITISSIVIGLKNSYYPLIHHHLLFIMRDSWLGLLPRQLPRDRNVELLI